MPQLDIFTLINQFIVCVIVLTPGMFLFRFTVYPNWDLFLRVREYRYGVLVKAGKTNFFKTLIIYWKLHCKHLRMKKITSVHYYSDENVFVDDVQKYLNTVNVEDIETEEDNENIVFSSIVGFLPIDENNNH